MKELRLAGISNIAEANMFLQEDYLPKINAKFAKPPINKTDAHVPLLPGQRLEGVFCFEEHRVVSRDYVLQFKTRIFQLRRAGRRRLPVPGTRVTVQKWLDGSVHFYHNQRELLVEEIDQLKKKEEKALSA